MDCTRRSFIKGLFGCVVAVSLPDISGKRVVKIERRFAPGEFFYLEYGPSDPPKILEFGLASETIRWDDTEEAHKIRSRLFKDLVLNMQLQPTKEAFDAYATGIYTVIMSGLASTFEGSAVLLCAMTTPYLHSQGFQESVCDELVLHPSFHAWRNFHKNRLRELQKNTPNDYDLIAQREFCQGPRLPNDHYISLICDDSELSPDEKVCRDEWLAKYGAYRMSSQDLERARNALDAKSWIYRMAVEKNHGKPLV